MYTDGSGSFYPLRLRNVISSYQKPLSLSSLSSSIHRGTEKEWRQRWRHCKAQWLLSHSAQALFSASALLPLSIILLRPYAFFSFFLTFPCTLSVSHRVGFGFLSFSDATSSLNASCYRFLRFFFFVFIYLTLGFL